MRSVRVSEAVVCLDRSTARPGAPVAAGVRWRRVLAAACMVLASGVFPATRADAQSCGGGSSGDLSGSGAHVGVSDQGCDPDDNDSGSGPGSGSGYYVRRTVRSEPVLCVATPDGLRETLRYYLAGTNTLVRTVTRCFAPDAPAPPLPPPPPSAISVFRQAPLVAPAIHLSPPANGLVGVETWLWWGVDPTIAPLSVAAGEWSASIQVHAPQLRWDLGNGDVVTSAAAGSGPDDPSLRYVYDHPCACTVTLTVRWRGTVTLTHPLAVAPIVQSVGPVDVTTAVPYAVEAREAVIVG